MSIEVIVAKPTGYDRQSQFDVQRALGHLRHRLRSEGVMFEVRRRQQFLTPAQDQKLKTKHQHKERKYRQNKTAAPARAAV